MTLLEYYSLQKVHPLLKWKFPLMSVVTALLQVRVWVSGVMLGQ